MLENVKKFFEWVFSSDEYPNPSSRKISIAMSAGSPLTFYVTVHTIDHREQVTFVPHYWCFPVENRRIMLIAGKTLADKRTVKIQYCVDTGHAYYDAGSMAHVA